MVSQEATENRAARRGFPCPRQGAEAGPCASQDRTRIGPLNWSVAQARDSRFDPVRAFVRKGVGDFDILLTQGHPGGSHHVSAPMRPGDQMPLVGITLFSIGFVVDTDSGAARR